MNDKGDNSSKKTLILKVFGERVRYLRNQKGWSQEVLAEKTMLHRTYIGSIERGERNVSLVNIYFIATALEISLEDLFKDVRV